MTAPVDYLGFQADGAQVGHFLGHVAGQRTWRVACACGAAFDMTSAALALVKCKSARDRLRCPACGLKAKREGAMRGLAARGIV